jgi:hypothetical protein
MGVACKTKLPDDEYQLVGVKKRTPPIVSCHRTCCAGPPDDKEDLMLAGARTIAVVQEDCSWLQG